MTIYAKSARFDNGHALNEGELRELAPSIFAVSAHASRSERFKPIPTIDVLRGLQKEGFEAVGARQSVSRIEGRADFTKHLVRLRRMDNVEAYKVGDNVVEILLKNANDGTSAYDLMAGMFRIRCMNSLVASEGTIDQVKVRHSGDVTGKVIEGTYTVLSEAQKVMAAPQDWSQIKLDNEARKAFAAAAHVLRFGDAEGKVNTPIMPEQLLEVRRAADQQHDLWTTFNVVQENVIKGGLHGVRFNEQGERRNMSSRAVNGIDGDIKLNKALWMLSAHMAHMAKWAA